jgi:hypothetical protein
LPLVLLPSLLIVARIGHLRLKPEGAKPGGANPGCAQPRALILFHLGRLARSQVWYGPRRRLGGPRFTTSGPFYRIKGSQPGPTSLHSHSPGNRLTQKLMDQETESAGIS